MSAIRLLLFGFIAVTLQGCLLPENIDDAEQSVVVFHERLNEADYDQIWTLTAPAFSNQEMRDEARALFAAMHSHLGPVLESEEIDASFYRYADAGETVTLVYHTTFERGQATETFVFTVGSGKPLIWNYNINSRTFSGADVSDDQRVAESAT